MIRMRDAATLALTKLRTRKIRLTITIVISGLLFAGLVGASMIARGAFASIQDFGKEGLGDRYIVSGTSSDIYGGGAFFANPTVIERAIAIQKDTVTRKKAEAKRLDIPYDPATEPPAFDEYELPGGGKQRSVAMQTDAGKQAINEYLAAHPSVGEAEFKKNAEKYNPKAFYQSMPFPYSSDGRFQVLKGGKENFSQNNDMKGGPSSGLDSFPSSWNTMSRDLLQPFILDGENLDAGSDGSIPVIVPYGAAEQLLGVKALPATASSEQKLARTKEVRNMAKEVTFTLCYRNSTSAGFIDSAISAQQEIERNKQTKDYKKPDLQYGLPTEPCGASTIIRDVRTAEQKKLEAKQEQFAQTFGKPTAVQQTTTFRLVGLVPDMTWQNAAGIGQIFNSLVTSTLGAGGWYSPVEVTDKNPLIAGVFNNPMAGVNGQRPTYYAEFKGADTARQFIAKQNCSPDFSVFQVGEGAGGTSLADMPDPIKACKDAGNYFSLAPFGSNSLALDGIKEQFGKIFTIAALVVAAIGAIIMMGTVGRMIADSRRETAVFRAIGAKRLDIAQTYLLYTGILSLMISGFAIIGGAIAAMIAQRQFAQDMTVQALVAYNAHDLNRTFSLFDFYLPDMLLLIAVAVGIGLISVAIPLIRNVRRNPIRDMRDDT